MGKGRKTPSIPASVGLQEIIRLYQQGNVQAAGQLAEKLLHENPEDTELLEIAAAIDLQNGNSGQAVSRLKQQVRLQPGNALAHSNLCIALHAQGSIDEAISSCRQAIQLDPVLADAWNNLGNIYKSVNHLEDALDYYEKALELNRNAPELHVNAGTASQLLGDLETAERRYRDAFRLHPEFPAAHSNLGTVLQRQGKHDLAESEFRTAIRMQPGNPEFLTNMGTLLLERGKYDQAASYLKQATQADRNYIGAWISMGNLSEKLGDHKATLKYWNKALLLDPGNTTVLCNKGFQLFDLGEQEEAISHFVRALERNPYSAKGLAGLGKAMLRQGILDKAEEYIEKAMKLSPWDIHVRIANAHLHSTRKNDTKAVSAWRHVIEQNPAIPEGYIGLGSHYSKLGQYNESRAQYRAAEANHATSAYLYHAWSQMEEMAHQLDEAEILAARAVDIDPNYPGLTILRAKLARRRKDYSTALNLLMQVDKNSIAVKQTKASYLFELGSILDKLGRYSEAFTAYREANEAKNCYIGRVYDPEDDKKQFRELKDVFSKAAWPELSHLSQGAGRVEGPQPVFIVGFPRSGTSLLEQILGSHREISPAGELAYIFNIRQQEAGQITGSSLPYPELINDPDHPLDSEKITKMRDYYLSAVHKQAVFDEQTRWFTDKLPHNAVHLGLVRMLFPKSPIIHISRHPLNPCLSAYISNFKSSHRYTSSLKATATHYRNMMDILDHYRTIGIDFIEVHYEDLVNDQETVTRRILEYIGAPWDASCLQHYRSERVVRTASYEQVTRKVYTSSLNRYQNYWNEVQDIIPILQSTIERYGYTVEPPPAEQ